MVDLLVVGAGPAGLGAALYARRAGLSVRVVDPRPGDKDKACGEGLMPAAVAALTSLGVTLDGRGLRGIRYIAGDSDVEAHFRSGRGLGVRRTTLARSMAEAADRAGVDMVTGSTSGIEQDGRSVAVGGHRARYLIAADGLHSPIRRSLGLQLPSATNGRRWGVRRHFATQPWTDLVEVHWTETAEAYVTPVADDLVGIAILSGGKRAFDSALAEFPVLSRRMSGSDGGSVAGAGPLRQRTSRRVAGRVLLVGDAAGYVDALTGEGIALGLAQARLAVDAVAGDDPTVYENRWPAVTRRYRWMTHGLVTATRSPTVRRALVPAAARMPWVFDGAVRLLAHG